MRVLLISTDPKIIDRQSAVSRRLAEYKKMFEKLDAVLWLGNVFKIFRLAKRYDVVSVQDPFETGIIGVLVKLFCGLPLQIQLHTDFNNKYFLLSSPLNFIRFFIAHLTLPFADSVRAVSERVKNSVRELNRNIDVLPIHVEKIQITNYKSQTNAKNIKILTIARLEKEKNLETAIKAFAKIAENNPNAEFVIVGDGREKDRLQNLSRNLNLASPNDSVGRESRIKFAGWRDDLVEIYNEADIYISTSLFEGYGMSMVEAACTKMPMVISDAGLAEEVFKNNESAFICKPKDINCFALALSKLVRDANLRMQMGEAAYTAVLSHKISKEEYLLSFKKGIESAALDLQKRSFAGRCIEFIKSVFEGNRIFRFILAGGASALSQIAILYFFTDVIGLWYLYSSILSFVIALFISFTLQKFWAFRDRVLRGVHAQFIKYAIIIFIGLLLNTALMFMLVDLLHFWYILAQIITGAIIAVFNFLSYRKFIFKT